MTTTPQQQQQRRVGANGVSLVMEERGAEGSKGEALYYQTGFGNTFESECIPGALPLGRNNPRNVPFQLYAEQLSGTAFTAPRHENRRVWLYRMQPSVSHLVGVVDPESSSGSSSDDDDNHVTNLHTFFGGVDPATCETHVNPLRWKPLPHDLTDSSSSSSSRDFIRGMRLMCHAGDPKLKTGLAIYMYTCNANMNMSSSEMNTYFYNADGEFLIVPQQGTLEIYTEVGRLRVSPQEIVVIPRGMVFQVQLQLSEDGQEEDASSSSSFARGYVLEVYQGSFQLPELGPIGSNGLANARDFYYPTAWCVTDPKTYATPCTILCKHHSKLYSRTSSHSPLNVVAWHGNYLPYKYHLSRFCAVNSVTYDHLDPSIYTVLTCPTDHAGTALADFVIFPPRVMATDPDTFRPPWYHRNTMSEFMGLIHGEYDAKSKAGFMPGGASLHVCMCPHGPDRTTYETATADPCETPKRFDGGLAFMFETCLSLQVAPDALHDTPAGSWRDVSYTTSSWQGLKNQFTAWHLFTSSEQSSTVAAVEAKPDPTS